MTRGCQPASLTTARLDTPMVMEGCRPLEGSCKGRDKPLSDRNGEREQKPKRLSKPSTNGDPQKKVATEKPTKALVNKDKQRKGTSKYLDKRLLDDGLQKNAASEMLDQSDTKETGRSCKSPGELCASAASRRRERWRKLRARKTSARALPGSVSRRTRAQRNANASQPPDSGTEAAEILLMLSQRGRGAENSQGHGKSKRRRI